MNFKPEAITELLNKVSAATTAILLEEAGPPPIGTTSQKAFTALTECVNLLTDILIANRDEASAGGTFLLDPKLLETNREANLYCLRLIHDLLKDTNISRASHAEHVLDVAAVQVSRFENLLDDLGNVAQPITVNLAIPVRPSREEAERQYKIEQYDELLKWFERYVEDQNHVRQGFGSLLEKIAAVVNRNNDHAKQALADLRQFQTDVVIYLRSVALVATSAANGGTHKQKESRLEVLVELIESAIDKVREEAFKFNEHWWSYHPDIFKSEYPVREYMRRAHEAEAEAMRLKELYEPSPKAEAAPGDIPF